MNILVLTTDYLPNIGGIAAHVHHLTSALATSGHNVFLVHIKDGKENGRIENKVVNQNLYLYTVVNDESKSRMKRAWNRSRLILRVYEQIVEDHGKVDIVHQHDHRSCNWALQLIKRENTWVWTNHSSGFLKDFESPAIGTFLRKLYRGVSGIIGVSHELLDKSQKLLGDAPLYKYIPNGVDTLLFHPDVTIKNLKLNIDRDADFIVLCPRRMVPKNGVIYLAKAVNQIVREEPDVSWKFIFLGSGKAFNTDTEYINEISNILDKPVKDGRVILLGNLSMKQMPEINKLADVVVMPSLMEAVSLSALEAMATKTPLIATNVGGLPEIVKDEDTGLLVSPQDSNGLAEAILRVYRNQKLKEHISEGGYRLATSEYSWNTVAEKTADFYKKVINN